MKIRLILALMLMICFSLNAEVLTIESESVTFDSKLPEVSIYNPLGGDVYSPDEIMYMDFSIVEDSFAEQSEAAAVLQFYFDEVYDPAYDVTLPVESLSFYDWTVAEVISEDVYVKITATDYYGNSGEAESGSFMIVNLEADFTADITEGNAPLEVQFMDITVGNIKRWSWDFDNDGEIDSYDPSPVWIYEAGGVYSVSLTVSNEEQRDIDTEVKVEYITVTDTIDAGFIADITNGYVPLEVQFSDTSAGNITNWSWDFDNDGVIDSYEQHPVWIYEETGVYSVSLIASNDEQEDSDTEVKFEYITVNYAPNIVVTPLEFNETLVSGDSLSQILTIENNGEGDLELSLNIMDLSRTWEQELNLTDARRIHQHSEKRQDNYAKIEPDGDINAYNRLRESLDDRGIYFQDNMENGLNSWTVEVYESEDLWHQSYSNYNSEITSWWCGNEESGNYNTGNRINTAIITPLIDLTTVNNAISLYFYENYNTEEGYDVCMVDISIDNGVNWMNLRGDANTAPSGSSGGWILSEIDINEYIGEQVQIRFYFDTGDGEVQEYPGWFIDDVMIGESLGIESWLSLNNDEFLLAAGTSVEIEVGFDAAYLSANDYFANIVVLSNDPDEPEIIVPITLTVIEDLNAEFTVSNTSSSINDTIQFTDLSAGTPISWAWDFENDGVIDSYDQNPEWVYEAGGVYSVSLTVSDEEQRDIDTELKVEYIYVAEPIDADFYAEITEGDAPLEVQFINTSVGEITMVAWDFENDGEIDSYDFNPVWVYEAGGVYSVSLMVSNEKERDIDTELKVEYITVTEDINADFYTEISQGDAPLEVQFMDTSAGNIINWSWDFENDGVIDSNDQNPVWVYEETGVYSVSLTVSDAEQRESDTEIKAEYITVNEPVDADFIADITEGDVPLEVQFTDTSTGNVMTWFWDFDNDGEIDSYDQHPVWVYEAGGVYSVSLTVSNEDSRNFDTEIKTEYITVIEPIDADFLADITDGYAPLEVQFTDISAGIITNWSWDFENDGIIDSYEQHPVWIYEAGGVYSVSLTVNDDEQRDSDTEVKVEYILVNYAPNIVVTPLEFNETLVSGDILSQTLIIDNNGAGELYWQLDILNERISTNRQGNIFEHIDFAKDEEDLRTGEPVYRGSGGPDIFGHIWTDSDESNGAVYEWFDISELGTNTGLSGDDSSVDLNLPFEFDFYDNVKTSVKVSTNGYLTFGNDGTDYSNDPIPSTYDPNDLIAPFWDDLARNSGNNYSYYDTENNRFIVQYSNWGRCSGAGDYNFQVQLYQNGTIMYQYENMTGALDSATIGIENVDASDYLSVVYNNNYLHQEMAITIRKSPEWLSADQYTGVLTTGTTQSISLLFDSTDLMPDNYVAEINITSNDPDEPEIVVSASLIVIEDLIAEFTVGNISNCINDTIQFTDLSTGTPISWAWDFENDGVIDSYEQHPVWVYEETGTYSVSLTVSDEGGRDIDTELKAEYILVTEPVEADFYADITEDYAPLEVQFTDASIGNMTNWFWDFDNDGEIDSYEQSPVWVYEVSGVYSVSLSVTNEAQRDFDTEVKVEYITVIMPVVADFYTEITYGDAPLEVQFMDTSSGNIINWSWDFENDGVIDSYEQHPVWIYEESGIYSVSLTVSDENGRASDTQVKVEYIMVNEPVEADFYADITEGITPLEIQFTDTSTGDVMNWFWDFDNDGEIDSYEQHPVWIYEAGGVYSVSLTVSNEEQRNIDTEVKVEYITAIELIDADFYADITEGFVPLEVQFTDTSAGNAMNWSWDFENDGIIDSYEQHPVWIYAETGVYSVSLMASDDEQRDSDTEVKVEYITVNYVPNIVVTPLEFNETLVRGDTLSQTLIIENNGLGELYWQLDMFNGIFNDRISANRQGNILEHIDFAKGEEDLRTGVPVYRGSGGPDIFGHIWTDSDESNGAVYEWFDISELGTNTELSGDDSSVDLMLPFEFDFYGEIKTSVKVSTNGYLTFGNYGGDYSNDPIPDESEPNDIIAPFWDDLHSSSGSNYSYYDTENSRFIIQYSNWGKYSGTGEYNFQVQLYQNGTIDFQYENMTGALNSATIGIENADASDYLSVVFNNDYLHEEMAISFKNSPEWLSANQYNGVLVTGTTQSISLLFDSSDIIPDNYEAEINITSNDPDEPEIIVPVSLIVTEDFNADFTVSNTSSCINDTIQFTDLSTGAPISWAWDFENDGVIDSNEQHPVWVYEETGIYSVSLTISDAEGRVSNTEIKVDYITVYEQLSADFNADVTEGDIPLVVQFNDLSNGNITNWAWDFENDGVIDSYVQNPVWNFVDAGVYSVSLTVSNDMVRASATELKEDYITANGELQFSPYQLNFGLVLVNSTVTSNMIITNAMASAVTIDSIYTDLPFIVGSYAGTEIGIGETLTIQVSFTPSATIFYAEELVIATNIGEYTVTVQGIGDPETPEWSFSWHEHDFGQVDIDTGAQTTLIVTNTGNLDLIVSDSEVSEEHFSVSEISFLLPVGQSQEIIIGFSPEEILQYNVVISYTSEAGTQDMNGYGNGFWLSQAPDLQYCDADGFAGDYGVNPQMGSSATYFEYRVIYSDADGNAPLPGFPQVGIDHNGDGDFIDPGEVCLPMTEVDAQNNDYINGKEYYYITQLPLDLDLGYKFLAYDLLGNIAIGEGTNYWSDPIVSDDELDLAIYANDITFSDVAPEAGQEITITALINNNSDYEAIDVPVAFYEEDDLIFETTIAYLPAQSQRSVTIEHIFIESGFYPIKVVIDEADNLLEENELNNFAVRPVLVGDYTIPGAIAATSYLNTTTVYPRGTVCLNGSAEYVGTRFRNTAVSGAQVQITVTGDNYNTSFIGYTNSSGDYSIYFTAPYSLGEYTASAVVTDFTLTANAGSNVFEVVPIPPTSYPQPDDLADLRMNTLTLSGSPIINNQMDINSSFTNIGDLAAANVKLHLYIDGMLADSLLYANIAVSHTENFSFHYTFFTVGYHYIQVVADPYNTITEYIEYNNYASLNRYIYPEGPDLTPQHIYFSNNSPLVGEEIVITFIIENLNYIASTATSVDIYEIYSDSGVETLMGNYPLEAVNGLSTELIVLEDYVFNEPGVHQIRINVDPANNVSESNEGNQNLYSTINVEQPTAELTISAINVSNTDPIEEELINFSATISNLGSNDAGSFEVIFSCDGEQIGGNVMIENLPMADNQIIISGTWAYNAQPHNITAEIDVNDSVLELNEFNNTVTRTIGIDLQPKTYPYYIYNSPSNRLEIQSGILTEFNCRIHNNGIFRANNVPIAYTIEEEVFGVDISPYVNPSSFSQSIAYLEFVQAGDFTLRVISDMNQEGLSIFDETNEENNYTDIYIMVYEDSLDLEILSQYIVPEELNPDPDEEIAIFASIFNKSNVDIDDFWVNIYVDDEVLEEQILVAGILAHDDITIECSSLYSSAVIGTHIISVEVDTNNDVEEYNETNNLASRAIIVGDAPDFRFFENGITMSDDKPEIGDLVSLYARIKNSGGADAFAQLYWWRVVNADSTLIDITDFELAAQDSTELSVFWYADSPYGTIFAEIVNSNPAEFNTFNNQAETNFGGNIIQIIDIEDIVMDEDAEEFTVADLDDVFQNIDNTQLSYYINTSEYMITSLNAQNELSIVPTENWFGSDLLTITAENIYGDVLNDIVNITVNSVNDAPVFDLPEFFTFRADSTLTLDFTEYISDVDGDEISLDVIQSGYVTLEIEDMQVTMSIQEYWYGSQYVIFTASDNQNRAVTEAEIEIIVTPMPLIADFIADVTLGGVPLEVQFTDLSIGNVIGWSWDFDDDSVIDSYEQHPVWVYNEPGTYSVSLSIEDGIREVSAGASRETSNALKVDYITVIISDPEIDLPENLSFNEDQSNSLNLENYIEYYNIEELTAAWSGNEEILISNEGLLLNISASPDWFGEELIYITVDNSRSRATATDSIWIIVEPVNDPPVLNITALFEAEEDIISVDYDFSLFCSQTWGENDVLTLSAENSEHIDVSVSDYIVTFESNTQDWFGIEDITFYLNDNIDALTGRNQIATINKQENQFSSEHHRRSRDIVSQVAYVTINPVNDAPAIDLPDSLTFDEDGMLEVDFANYVNDVDNVDLVLSVTGGLNTIADIYGLNVTFTAIENWFGNETLTFTIDDQQGRVIASDEVEIIVTSINDLPIANAGEEYFGQANVTDFCEIMLNGTESYDIDGEIVSWQWTWESGSAEGEEVLAEFPAGITEVTLTVTDNETGIDTDSVQVSISIYENLAPVAIADEYSLNEDTEFSDNVMTNDYDPDEYPPTFGLIAEQVSDVSNGTLVFADNGDFTYLPELNWNGADAFSYRVYDGEAYSEAVTVTLIVNPVNDAPTIELPDSLAFAEDGMLEVDFANYVDDVDNVDLELLVTGESNINAEITGLNVTFTATENWFGNEILTFTIDDQQGRITASDDVVIIVTSVNDMPIADAGEEYSSQADVNGLCEIMLNGTGSYDIDGEIVSWQWTWESGSAEGEEVLAEFSAGITEVTLTVTDNEAGIDTDSVQVSISIYENLVPVAITDEYSLNEDTEFSDNVMTNDYDPDEYPPTFGMIAELVSDVSNGTLDFAANGDFTYLPELNWNGADAFSYRVYDGEAYSEAVTVTLIVNPVNDAPTIELPDSLAFAEDGMLEVDFANYVDDVDNVDLELLVTGESNINAEITGLNVTFTATENWFGNETLTFTIDDQQGRVIASDEVEIIVTSINDLPIANAGDEYSGQADVNGFCEIMLNGTGSYDIDGEIVSWQWTWGSGSAEGEEVLVELPIGTTEVTLTVTDNETGIDTDIAQVSISIYENLVPVAIADEYALNEDTEFSDNVMTNDYDPDEYPPTMGMIAELVSDVSNGTLDFAANGDFTYLPELNWNGTDAFSYRVYDGEAYSETVTVTLIVNPVNDVPTIDLPESFTFMENGQLQVYFSEFADDVDNDELMLSVTGEVNVLVNISGMTVILTAVDSWSGSEILTFIVDDNQGRLTASDNVEIIVTPVTGITISKDLTAGWNWFSLNVYNDDMFLNNVLGSLGDTGTYIKSQTQFADYYPDTGWFGSLDLINNYDFYRLDMAASGLLEFTGTPVNVNEMIYDLSSGWNWISYAAQTAMGINDALTGLGDNAAYIKSQTQFSTYNPDDGWFGSLMVMQPLNGYMLDVNIAGEFTYPVSVRTMAYNDETVTEINPHAFEFNGSILMTADYDIPQDSRIMAYCNGELRGVSELLDYTKELGKKYYALMLYSDQENEAEFELYYQNSPIDELKSLGYNFTFTADMRIGDFIDPVIIELPITDTNGLSKSVISSYPNPFNPETTIEYELNEDGLALIEIYNVKGQKIETLVNETKQSGRYLLRWNAENRSSGIYYLSFKIGNTHQVKKLLLLR